MLNQLNSTTKRELQSELTNLSNRVNTYLSTEQKVGRFGDDDLYQITIDCGALPNATSKVVTTDIIAKDILRYDVFATRTFESGDYKKQVVTIPNGYVGGGDITTVAYINNNDKIVLSLSAGADRTMFNGLAIMLYTKPTPTQP